ncbi:MAG: nucleoside monophosphate kinase [Phycisphaerae bacterium]|nr:nucleoside monophosphate kinase [Phycisphaerae bacterium]
MRHQTVLIFGPPGSGKGTQGRVLGSIPGFYHCSCGDVFRRIDVNSEIGRTFVEFSSKGELVPDDVTIRMWHAHIRAMHGIGAYKPYQDLLILDGIPRTVNQAELLEEELEVLKVMRLVCQDEEKMIERLRRRAIKENRMDDAKEEVIRNRWEVYRQESQPVMDHYPPEMIAEIDAMPSPAEVLRQILEYVIPIQNAHFRKLARENVAG